MSSDTDYDSATLDQAWLEYRTADYTRNNPDSFVAFRAGYRRGVAQGALIASTTFFHAADLDEQETP